MVHFDEAYVPVFYHVYKNDLDKASSSMFLLDARWQKFQDKYQLLFKDDIDGLERLRYIDDWLCDTKDAIFRNDQFTAMVQLDHMKYEMMEIRRSYKMEYFLDYLWDFEGALSMLSEVSCEDNTLVCSPDELAFLIEEAIYLWQIVDEAENMPFSKVFGGHEMARFEQFKNEVTKNLKLVEAEKYSSQKNLAATVDRTFESFMNLLTLFGDFDAVNSYYAQNLQH